MILLKFFACDRDLGAVRAGYSQANSESAAGKLKELGYTWNDIIQYTLELDIRSLGAPGPTEPRVLEERRQMMSLNTSQPGES